MPPQQRYEYARQIKACYNCLQPDSKFHTCSKYSCHVCNRRHHTLLHVHTQPTSASNKRFTSTPNPSSNQQGSAPAEVNTYCSFKSRPINHVLLATAIVEVRNKYNQYVPCRVLLDSASQLSFISEKCVQRLRLPRTQTPVAIQGINNVNTATHHSVFIHLRSRHTNWHTTLNCAVLSNITGTTPSHQLDTISWNLPKDIRMADEHFDRPGGIDILLGADVFFEILQSGRRTRPGNYPVLQETVLGWTLAGQTPAVTQNSPQRTFLLHDDNNLEHNLNRFWELESMEQPSMTAEQRACEEHFLTHTKQQSDGRFVVRLPTKMESNQLGSSRLSAEQRLLAIERRL